MNGHGTWANGRYRTVSARGSAEIGCRTSLTMPTIVTGPIEANDVRAAGRGDRQSPQYRRASAALMTHTSGMPGPSRSSISRPRSSATCIDRKASGSTAAGEALCASEGAGRPSMVNRSVARGLRRRHVARCGHGCQIGLRPQRGQQPLEEGALRRLVGIPRVGEHDLDGLLPPRVGVRQAGERAHVVDERASDDRDEQRHGDLGGHRRAASEARVERVSSDHPRRGPDRLSRPGPNAVRDDEDGEEARPRQRPRAGRGADRSRRRRPVRRSAPRTARGTPAPR